MRYPSDRDGKSRTASAVDQAHYPEQHEAENFGSEAGALPSRDQIAAKAFELWQARGCPQGSAEQDWLEAEAELQLQAASSDRMQNTAARARTARR